MILYSLVICLDSSLKSNESIVYVSLVQVFANHHACKRYLSHAFRSRAFAAKYSDSYDDNALMQYLCGTIESLIQAGFRTAKDLDGITTRELCNGLTDPFRAVADFTN